MLRTLFYSSAAVLLLAGSAAAQQADPDATAIAVAQVSLPWTEFKQLYAERLQREWEAARAEREQALYSIDSAVYELRLSPTGARGTLRLSGQLLQGEPQPLRLFVPDLTITQVKAIEGGTLLSDAEGYRLYLTQPGAFALDCEILLPLREDQRSPFVAFTIPAAVKNSLRLEPDAGLRILEAPGQSLDKDVYFFAPRQALTVRFAPADSALGQAPLVDSFSRFELLDDHYRVTVYLAPRRELSQPLRVRFPQARWLGASVQRSWISVEGDELVLKLPPDWRQPLTLDYQLSAAATAVQLPAIAGNLGQDGAFQVLAPESARIGVTADGLRRGLDVGHLPPALREYAGIAGSYAQASGTAAVQFALERFATVAEPAVVLESVHQYTSIADNGTLLSVVRLQVPPLPQQRLVLPAVADAAIWSLTVNGAPRSVYGQDDGQWIVPLAEGESLVELAYWRKTPRLSLQGRLELPAPALGLAARSYNLALGLPERVELVALEGDLEPGDGSQWPSVSQFSGRPYYFTQPFYRGEPLVIGIHYREPVAAGTQEAS
jgi:hypothetical protein